MSPETQIALYGLLVTVFALLVTAGNYLVQKYLNKTMRGLAGELEAYKVRGAPTPDFVTKLYDDIKDLRGYPEREGGNQADFRSSLGYLNSACL
jgi:hypothetical protein